MITILMQILPWEERRKQNRTTNTIITTAIQTPANNTYITNYSVWAYNTPRISISTKQAVIIVQAVITV